MPCNLSLNGSVIFSSPSFPSVKGRRTKLNICCRRSSRAEHTFRVRGSISNSRNTSAHHATSQREAVSNSPLSNWLGGALSSAIAVCLTLQLPAVAVAAPDVSSVGDLVASTAGMLGNSNALKEPASAPEAANSSVSAPENSASSPTESSGGLQTVYFGNGCFWGRQKDFVDVEVRQLGRSTDRITALVGYAAGTRTGPGGKVCYVYSDPRTHYDALGHAEVVQLGVSSDPGAAEGEVRAFASRYFDQFKKTSGGMQRSDPQDRGSAYRNVIGIPGGIRSPLFSTIQEENKYGMVLLEGRGNDMSRGGPTEDDVLNTVWVVDSDTFPFYRAERYHQFHNGLGKRFPLEYVRDLRDALAGLGRIEPTGCPELPF